MSFNNFAPYSILANFIAVPLASFYLMPLVVLFFVAQLFSLENPVLWLMKPAIELIIYTASEVKFLPLSKILIEQLDSFYIYSFIMLMIIYFAASNKIIKNIVLLLALVCLPFFKIDKPDLIINKKEGFAISMIENKLYSYPKKIPSWAKRNYLSFYGESELNFTKDKFSFDGLGEGDNRAKGDILFYNDQARTEIFCSDCGRPWGQ